MANLEVRGLSTAEGLAGFSFLSGSLPPEGPGHPNGWPLRWI